MKREIVKELSCRIKIIRNELKLNQKQFAAKIGVASSYVSELENGKIGAGFDFLYKLTLHYDINPLFLFQGKGPTFLSNEFEKENATSREPLFKDQPIKELFQLIERSDMFKFAVLSFFEGFKIENSELLKKELRFKKEGIIIIADQSKTNK